MDYCHKIVNYSQVEATKDFSGRPLNKNPLELSSYFPGFNWEGVVLAGGAVLSFLRQDPINDFDFFIFGNSETIITKMVEIEKYFRTMHELAPMPSGIKEEINDLYVRDSQRLFGIWDSDPEIEEERVRLGELNSVPAPYKRAASYVQMQFSPDESGQTFPTVQMIAAEDLKANRTVSDFIYERYSHTEEWMRDRPVRESLNNPYELVNRFDFSCCKCWFDGENIWGTKDQVETLVSTGIIEVKARYHASVTRIIKYHKKGFLFRTGFFLDIAFWGIPFDFCLDQFSDLPWIFILKYQKLNLYESITGKGNLNISKNLMQNEKVREVLSRPLRLDDGKLEAIHEMEKKFRPRNSGFIVDSLKEAFSYGPFIPVCLQGTFAKWKGYPKRYNRGGYFGGEEVFSGIEVYDIEKNRMEENYSFEDLAREITKRAKERERNDLIAKKRAWWMLEGHLKHVYYKPGGPGSLKALEQSDVFLVGSSDKKNTLPLE